MFVFVLSPATLCQKSSSFLRSYSIPISFHIVTIIEWIKCQSSLLYIYIMLYSFVSVISITNLILYFAPTKNFNVDIYFLSPLDYLKFIYYFST